MNLLEELRGRFAAALRALGEDDARWLEQVVPAKDPRFGHYQANMAMPLAGKLGRPPREVAQQIVHHLQVDDLCQEPEVAGPGFINLRLRPEFVAAQLQRLKTDPRLGVPRVSKPRTVVLDYSSPNVAKPMHVGHIRSTVIGDCLYRVHKFLGHHVIGDNHIGDWGTQFGMILYGYKHFLDADHYRQNPVEELARLYRLVNRLVSYRQQQEELPRLRQQEEELRRRLAQLENQAEATEDAKQRKKLRRQLQRLQAQLQELHQQIADTEAAIAQVEADPQLAELARQHPDIAQRVLEETAKLHAGDEENRRLWREFMPACLEALERIYRRLGVRFDVTLGESFYQDRLAPVVEQLLELGVAQESEGAVCVFLPEESAPLIVRKKDGAFLYATTDLATLQYRMERWAPDAVLYVVDHRQSLHFRQLFATARLWAKRVQEKDPENPLVKLLDCELTHVSFGTILGSDGKPFRTRAGDTVGLESLLDEAVEHALRIVSRNDDAKPTGPELSPEQRRRVAEAVGIGAIKYADLSHHRTSDYVFSFEKMMSTTGNTATYMQYAYARIRSILRRGGVDVEALRSSEAPLLLESEQEHRLALALLRFPEAVAEVLVDYRPNLLTNYLFEELATHFTAFYEQCPVLKAPSEPLRRSRLVLCDLTARVIQKGLELLGIQTVEQM